MAINKVREEIANTFIKALQEDTIPWEREWISAGIPANITNGREYHGANRLWLSYVAEQKGYKDSRWCTFNQANKSGYKIKKGEHGTRIEFWSVYDTVTKKKLSRMEFERLASQLESNGQKWDERVKPISSTYVVFNAEQMDGVPKIEFERPVSEELLIGRDRLLEAMKIDFVEGGNQAFYKPSDDSIHMPDYKNFKSDYGYMATFLHEAGHATGAEHRLNRNIKNIFGTPDYAREELRAEISSAFTAQAIGIGGTPKLQNHKAYIQSWIEILKNNPNELFIAVKDAEKISDYLIEKGGFIRQKETAQERQDIRTASLPDRGNPEYFKCFYIGEQTQEAYDYQKKTGYHMLWASDSHGMNGDTYVVYRSIDDLPKFLRGYAASQEALEEKVKPIPDVISEIEKLKARKQKMTDREAERL